MDGRQVKNITVLIAGRPYPLKIQEYEEPAINRIVSELNLKINELQQIYRTKDKQDYLSMVLLTYALDLKKSQTALNEADRQWADKLSNLEALLDQLI